MKRGKKVLAAILIMLLALNLTMPVLATEPVEGEAVQDEAEQTELTEEERLQQELDAVYALPVESNEIDNWPQGPGTYGEAAIVMEVETGAILYAKNIDAHHFPASITKVLTTLIALENGQFADPVYFSNDCVSFLQPDEASIGMDEGNQISLEQALYATLLASANEVAYAVGENVGKNAGYDYNWFVDQMNLRCQELGGANSNFMNTNGLHDPNHYTCARDMALIGRELFRHPEFFTIAQTYEYKIPESETTEEHVFQQHHKMLIPDDEEYYEFAVGGKTGYTSDALSTLITMADNGSMQLVCVVLKTHGKNVYPDTKNLLEYGFANFSKVSAADYEASEDIQSIGSIQETETVSTEGAAVSGGYVIVPNGVEFKDLEMEILPDSDVSNEGTVEYRFSGNLMGSVRAVLSQAYMEKRVSGTEDQKPDSKTDTKSKSKKDTEKKENGLLKGLLNGKTVLEKRILAVCAAVLAVLVIAFIVVLVRVIRGRKRKKRR